MTTPAAGNAAALYTGGAATVMTSEACTLLADTHVAQITAAAKRAISYADTLTVYDGGSPVATTAYTVDYAQGKITFTADVAGHTITVTGKYIPLLQVLWARSANVEVGSEYADVSRFGDAAKRSLKTRSVASVELETLQNHDEDMDPGGGVLKLSALLLAGGAVFLSILLGTNADTTRQQLRGWFALPSGTTKAQLTEAISTSLKLEGVVLTGDHGDLTLFGFA